MAFAGAVVDVVGADARSLVDPAELLPGAERPPIVSVENASLGAQDMLPLIAATVDAGGLVAHNLVGYNELVEEGLNWIMSQHFNIDRTSEIPR